MIARERNTVGLRYTLFARLLEAGGKANKVTAVLIGVRWERWANRVGLWGTESHWRRQATGEDHEIDLFAGPAR